jgi:endoglucanase Acf2
MGGVRERVKLQGFNSWVAAIFTVGAGKQAQSCAFDAKQRYGQLTWAECKK